MNSIKGRNNSTAVERVVPSGGELVGSSGVPVNELNNSLHRRTFTLRNGKKKSIIED